MFKDVLGEQFQNGLQASKEIQIMIAWEGQLLCSSHKHRSSLRNDFTKSSNWTEIGPSEAPNILYERFHRIVNVNLEFLQIGFQNLTRSV